MSDQNTNWPDCEDQPWAWIDAVISKAPMYLLCFALFVALLVALGVAAGWIPLYL